MARNFDESVEYDERILLGPGHPESPGASAWLSSACHCQDFSHRPRQCRALHRASGQPFKVICPLRAKLVGRLPPGNQNTDSLEGRYRLFFDAFAIEFHIRMTLPELFAAQVARTPDADAVVFEDERLALEPAGASPARARGRSRGGGGAVHRALAVRRKSTASQHQPTAAMPRNEHCMRRFPHR